jgi:hypothetical protein
MPARHDVRHRDAIRHDVAAQRLLAGALAAYRTRPTTFTARIAH